MFTIYDTTSDHSFFGPFDTYEDAATTALQIVHEGFLDDYVIIDDSEDSFPVPFWYMYSHQSIYTIDGQYYCWCDSSFVDGIYEDEQQFLCLAGPQPA